MYRTISGTTTEPEQVCVYNKYKIWGRVKISQLTRLESERFSFSRGVMYVPLRIGGQPVAMP